VTDPRTLQGMARVRSGQAPPGPWFLTGVSVEAPGSSMTSRVHSPGTFPWARRPAVTVMLDAGGAGTYTQRAIPGPGLSSGLAPSGEPRRTAQGGAVAPSPARLLEVHWWQVLDIVLGDIELDPGIESDRCADGNGDVLA